MTCRFVILKEIDGEPGVFIEYDEKILAERIKARMTEHYVKMAGINAVTPTLFFKNVIDPALEAFEEAFKTIMTEFHDNSSK